MGRRDAMRAELRKVRYLALSNFESAWEETLGSFKLPANAIIMTSPFFEGGEIEIRIRLKSLKSSLRPSPPSGESRRAAGL